MYAIHDQDQSSQSSSRRDRLDSSLDLPWFFLRYMSAWTAFSSYWEGAAGRAYLASRLLLAAPYAPGSSGAPLTFLFIAGDPAFSYRHGYSLQLKLFSTRILLNIYAQVNTKMERF